MPQEMSQPQTASRIFSETWGFSKHSLRPVCCRATSEGSGPGGGWRLLWGHLLRCFPGCCGSFSCHQIVIDYVTYKQQEFIRLTVPESGESKVQGCLW